MSETTRRSPSPSEVGIAIGRRNFLRNAAGVAGAGVLLPSVLAACGGSDTATTEAPGTTAASGTTAGSGTTAAAGTTAGSGTTAAAGTTGAPGTTAAGGGESMSNPFTATGEVTLGSNYSNELPKKGLQAAVDNLGMPDVTVKINEVDHNTFQENISTYLQSPDDVIPWFAGYRMRYFAAKDLLGDMTPVWDAGLNDLYSEGFKTASTGDDGKQYFVPWTYYSWGIYYRPSVFDENSWTPPTTWDELTTLAEDMKAKGLVPFALGNDGNWPAMGTFDQLNFRMNGYQFHVDLMAGKESWTDPKVKAVFTQWQELLGMTQEDPNGRTWEEAAAAIVNKEAGMMIIGTFIGSQFPDGDTSDLDFFPFPELNPEHGTDTIEAPIDGWIMAKSPKNQDGANALAYHFGTPPAQDAYLTQDPSVVVPAKGADTGAYSPLQQKVLESVSSAKYVTQFLDRDTSPEFASNVAGPRFADFIADPTKVDSILQDMEDQAKVIFAE